MADQIEYLHNPHLPIIKPGYRGNKLINGQFANGQELYNPKFTNVLKWQLTPNPQRQEKKHDTFVPEVKQAAPGFGMPQDDVVVWLGHASFFIRLNGVNFLTDPVFYDLPLVRRRVEMPLAPETIRNIDVLLLSHGHRDHFDVKSLRTLFRHNPQIQALVPLKMGKLLQKAVPGMPHQEAGWWQQFQPPELPVEVFYLPARHWHRRGLTDMNKVLWGSFLLRTPERTVFFAGDTASGPHFDEIQDLFGALDVCILPIGAYQPPFLMRNSHMNPHEAVKAFHQLRGETFIPMHFGTFDLSDEPPGEPLRLVQQIAQSGLLHGRLVTPAIGELVPV